jgi:hypothetical protein
LFTPTWPSAKSQTTPSFGKDDEKMELSFRAGEKDNQAWCFMPVVSATQKVEIGRMKA